MEQQSTTVSPKAPPAPKAASPPSFNKEANELITEARREAQDILKEARSAAATQASSLLEVGETLVLVACQHHDVGISPFFPKFGWPTGSRVLCRSRPCLLLVSRFQRNKHLARQQQQPVRLC